MIQKQVDPLTYIPAPDVIRARLQETEAVADRLCILLDVAERIEATRDRRNVQALEGQGVSRGR